MTSLKVKERLNPVNGTDFTADIGETPLIFRIPPARGKMVDLSSVNFTGWLDTNAYLKYAAPVTNNADIQASLQNAEQSFKYPGGISSFIGRVRVALSTGLILEEIEGVNILAQTRELTLSADEANVLHRNECKMQETNYGAFQIGVNKTAIVGFGNKSVGSDVQINQEMEFRFSFATLGGFMNQTEFPLDQGLDIYIYWAEFTNQREISGCWLDDQARAAYTAEGSFSDDQTYSTVSALYPTDTDGAAFSDIGQGRKVMFASYYKDANNKDTYLEQGAYLQAGTAVDPLDGSYTLKVGTVAGTPGALQPIDLDGYDARVTPIDYVSKLRNPVDTATAIDYTANNTNKGYVAGIRAHSAGVSAVTGAANVATLTIYADQMNTLVQPYGSTQWAPRSPYGHMGLYPGRLIKILVNTLANETAYQYDYRRIATVTVNAGAYVLTLDTPCAFGAAPVAPTSGSGPIADVVLAGPADLDISGTPMIRRAAVEFETIDVAKRDSKKTISFESKFWRTELFNLTNGMTDPFVTSSVQCKHLDGIICATPYLSYTLDNPGFETVLPLYNGRNLMDQPLKLLPSSDFRGVPNEVVWAYEQAIGMPIKRPSLMSYLGQNFDYGSLYYASAFPADIVAAQYVFGVTNFAVASSAYAIGIPCDGLNTFEGRIQLRFRGTVDFDGPMYMFNLHRREIIYSPVSGDIKIMDA